MSLARHLLAVCLCISLIAKCCFGFQKNPVAVLRPNARVSHGWNCMTDVQRQLVPTVAHDFALYLEKRHKEALWGKKFRSTGTSSQVKHYRIVGRGGGLPRLRKVSGMPTKRMELPARRCMLLGKMDNTKARQISHSGKRTHRKQKLNLQWRRIWYISKGHYVRLRLSMKGLKTIKRLGLEEAARRFHLNIDNPKLFAGYANLSKKRESNEIVFEECEDDVDITNI